MIRDMSISIAASEALSFSHGILINTMKYDERLINDKLAISCRINAHEYEMLALLR